LSPPVRVGFVFGFGDDSWLGGISYFRNLLAAIHDNPKSRIAPVVIVSREADAKVLDGFPRLELLRTDLVNPKRVWWKGRRALQTYAGRDILFETFLRRHRIAALSHSGHLGKFSPIPALPWIPDFQEIHLPENFSAKERAERARIAAECCEHAASVIFSSCTAQQDFVSTHTVCRAGSEILHFVANVPASLDVASLAELEARYGHPSRFFFLPNQFWAHKNHGVVLEALTLLKAQGLDLTVVASGRTADHRWPGYYDALMDKARSLGVHDQFRSLGVIPYRDLMGLMAASVAVINPSLFEGWSTTVEEAKSMGKTVVLSDIPTHREQAPEHGVYFPAHDPDALAGALLSIWRTWDEAGDRRNMKLASEMLPVRRRAFAQRFEDIVIRAVRTA
jgi:glycosyltransferase involved in cell wall biosynthesis